MFKNNQWWFGIYLRIKARAEDKEVDNVMNAKEQRVDKDWLTNVLQIS